jgi:hypothetical protein
MKELIFWAAASALLPVLNGLLGPPGEAHYEYVGECKPLRFFVVRKTKKPMGFCEDYGAGGSGGG